MKIHMQRDLNAGTGEKLRLGFPMEVELDAGEKAAFTAAISQLDKVLKDPGQYTMDEVYQIAEALNSELGGSSMYQQGLSNYGYAITSVDEAMKAQQAQLAEYNAKVDGGNCCPEPHVTSVTICHCRQGSSRSFCLPSCCCGTVPAG